MPVSQRKDLIQRINRLKTDIIEEEGFLQSCTKEYDLITERQQQMTRKLAGLENDFSKLTSKAKALKEERFAIEDQVSTCVVEDREEAETLMSRRDGVILLYRFMQLIES